MVSTNYGNSGKRENVTKHMIFQSGVEELRDWLLMKPVALGCILYGWNREVFC